LALARKHEKVLAINEESGTMPTDIAGVVYLNRPKGQASEKEAFLNLIDNWLAEQAEKLSSELYQEPLRLLSKKEYRAAVISVMTLLENKLRKNTQIQDGFLVRNDRAVSLGRLTQKAMEAKLLTEKEGHMIREWTMVRNRAVHTTEEVTAKEARSIVKSVMAIINKLKI